jgi:hypothetical protein
MLNRYVLAGFESVSSDLEAVTMTIAPSRQHVHRLNVKDQEI